MIHKRNCCPRFVEPLKNKMEKQTVIFKETYQVFVEAIKAGKLSKDSTSELYVEKYMYMGTVEGKDTFKNIETREYLKT